jgi:hypothetical protein
MSAYRSNNQDLLKLEENQFNMKLNISKGIRDEFSMKKNWIKRIMHS